MKRSTIREHVFRILFRYDFYGQEDFAEQAALYFDARVPEKIVPIMYRKEYNKADALKYIHLFRMVY